MARHFTCKGVVNFHLSFKLIDTVRLDAAATLINNPFLILGVRVLAVALPVPLACITRTGIWTGEALREIAWIPAASRLL
jgi:hypothetical protein